MRWLVGFVFVVALGFVACGEEDELPSYCGGLPDGTACSHTYHPDVATTCLAGVCGAQVLCDGVECDDGNKCIVPGRCRWDGRCDNTYVVCEGDSECTWCDATRGCVIVAGGACTYVTSCGYPPDCGIICIPNYCTRHGFCTEHGTCRQ
jgi:hypothetical protein